MACIGFWECVEPGTWPDWIAAIATALGIAGALLGYGLNRRAKWREQALEVVVRAQYSDQLEGHQVAIENLSDRVIVDPELWFYQSDREVGRAIRTNPRDDGYVPTEAGIMYEAWEDRSGNSTAFFKRIKAGAISETVISGFETYANAKLVFIDAKGRRWMTDIRSGRVRRLWTRKTPFIAIR